MLYNLYMDFVMRIYIDACNTEGIKFLKLKYNIPSSASSTGNNAVGKMKMKMKKVYAKE